ncbi:MFS transporter [Streptomyces sp. NBC_00659]|uniref:MFS transporter n=1 Tax=Streptomyces sp. NBC_00659 TaxID=2903669 RepID=UPI002E351919|nr:MFS transporter [Streptomyces sp. NBC_00659]
MPADAPPPTTDVSGPAHRLRISLLMAGSCLPVLGAVLLAPVLPKMQDHFEGTSGAEALVPLVLTIPALALALLAPFAGMIVDRLGRRRLLLVATVVYALCGTAPLWLDSLEAILASRVLVGLCEAAIMTCCTTLIGDYYQGLQRARYLSLQTMCTAASATVFFVVGGAAGSAGWRVPFWLYAVSLLIAPLMAIALPSATTRTSSEHRTPLVPDPERHPFPWRQMRATCALTFFGAMVFYTVPVEMSYLLDDLGITSSGVIGLATAVASAATVIGAMVFARMRRAPEQVLPPVLALCAIGFGLMYLADNAPFLVAGAVVNCLGTGMLLPALLIRGMSRLEFADRGRGTGLWTSAMFGGTFVLPLALLGVEKAVGSLASAVGMLGVAAALVAAGLVWAQRRTAGVGPYMDVAQEHAS